MKLLFKYTLFVFLLISLSLSAQIVSEQDTLSGTPLTMSMDKKISDLLKDQEENCLRDSGSKSTRNVDDNSSTRPSVSTPSRPLSRAEICARNPRILGYKIQIAVVKSNAEANEVKAYFRRRFPNVKVETDASLRPNYRILAGSYISKESAAGDLRRIRQYFNQARSVQYRVFCEEAK